jgi:ornithine carbamoyltransferase
LPRARLNVQGASVDTPVQPFVDLLSVDERFVRSILDLAVRYKAAPHAYSQALKGRMLYALYQKTSTRTHVSFAQAADLLGAAYVPQSWEHSNFRISDLECETKYVSTVADFFMVRPLRYSDVRRIADVATIPVINGCCDTFHPMQVLADALTIHEHFGRIGGQRLLYIGVDNNVLNSLSTLMTQLGVHVVAFTPERNVSAFDQRVADRRAATPLFEHPSSMDVDVLREELGKADVVYLDTWVDMEKFEAPDSKGENAARIARMRQFTLTPELYAGSRAAIMHCMPIHPGYEIERSMVDHPSSVIFPQAANRTYAQAASMLTLVGP